MSWENDLLMKFSNDVERCEIEETKWVKTTHLFKAQPWNMLLTLMAYHSSWHITAVGISQQLV